MQHIPGMLLACLQLVLVQNGPGVSCDGGYCEVRNYWSIAFGDSDYPTENTYST